MSFYYKVLVLRLLIAIYKQQLAVLRIKPEKGLALVNEAEDFLRTFIEKEKPDNEKR